MLTGKQLFISVDFVLHTIGVSFTQHIQFKLKHKHKAKMVAHNYQDVVLSVSGGIGTIKMNRPSSLNAFGGNLMLDIVAALRELNEHPKTVFTVITGEGRFVSPSMSTASPRALCQANLGCWLLCVRVMEDDY